jgi:hypothetical protein
MKTFETLVRLFRVVVALLALVLICYGLARTYLSHEVTRADQMLNDLETIKIGDGEDVARSVTRRYDGYRRDQETLKRMYEKPDYRIRPANTRLTAGGKRV